MKILYRYVYTELWRNFFLILGLFVFVILMDRASVIAETVLGQGVSFFEFFSVLLKGVPAFLGITIPMAFILSVLITFIQMSSNNELTALRSCGVSVKSISLPVFVMGGILSFFSFYVLMFVMPESNISMKREIQTLVKKRITLGVTKKNFTSNFPGITFYAENVYPDKGYLRNFMVSLQKRNKLITIFAQEGLLRTVGDTVFLDIKDGTAQFLDWRKYETLKVLNFKNYTVKLYTFSNSENFKATKYRNMFQLFEHFDLDSKVEFFKRLTLSLSPFIVGIVAFSVAVVVPRGSVGGGVLIALVIIIVYYILYTFSKKFALKLGLPVLTLMPDVVFGSLAYYLYNQALREKIRLEFGGRW